MTASISFWPKWIPKDGYNINQSQIAIGSGGILGKGFLEGTQTKGNFVPEQQTDYIFTTVGEEWGFHRFFCRGCFIYDFMISHTPDIGDKKQF